MPDLQELERPIDETIVSALIEATPGWWKTAKLEIVWSPKKDGIEGFQHSITSPEGHRDIVQATDAIFAATFQLADLFRRFGKPWKKVAYSVTQTKSGDWDYSADFEY